MRYQELLEKIQKALLDKEPTPSHSYTSVSGHNIPQKMPTQPVPIKKALRKTDIVTKEWNDEVKHTSQLSSSIETPSPKKDLIPTRFNRWGFRNCSSFVRKLQKLSEHKTEEMAGKVSLISNEKEQSDRENKKQDQLWRDLMKDNVERHFRIDRITNFFS